MLKQGQVFKWINIIGLNLRLDFKNTVYAPYALVRTRLYGHRHLFMIDSSVDCDLISRKSIVNRLFLRMAVKQLQLSACT